VSAELHETELLGFVGSTKRRLEVRLEPNRRNVLLLVQHRGADGALKIVPLSLLNLGPHDLVTLLDTLRDALGQVRRAFK
jgi:hypothetical protein